MHSWDYVLALKANHPKLHEQIKDWFNQAIALNFEGVTFSYDERVEKGHHRTQKLTSLDCTYFSATFTTSTS